jgi:hypothetical protein
MTSPMTKLSTIAQTSALFASKGGNWEIRRPRETSVARPTHYRVATDSAGLTFPPSTSNEMQAQLCVGTSRCSAASLRSSGGGQLKSERFSRRIQSPAAVIPIDRLAAILRLDLPPTRSLITSRILRIGNLCPEHASLPL